MTTYRVTAPVATYTGEVGSISFAKGVAFVNDTENAGALEYFRAQGYQVEDVADLPPTEADSSQVDALNARIAELEAQLAEATAPTKTSGTAAKGATK